MKLQGVVLWYSDIIAEFELSDVTGSYKEDDVLYVRSNLGETPIIYSTIKPACEHIEIDTLFLRNKEWFLFVDAIGQGF